jgi:hypothetical protein
METACHGLGRSDPDLPDDAPVRCFFNMSETHRPLVIDADLPGAVTVSARRCLLADLKANPERRRWLSPGSGFKSSDDS